MAVTNEQRLKAAHRVKERSEKNITFIRERLKIQEEHEDWWNKGRWEKSGGQWADLSYHPWMLDHQQKMVDKCNVVIKELS